MKKAIVTGACGFIGLALVECLCNHGVEVLALGRPGTGDRLPKREGLTFLGLDLNDIQRLPELVPERDWDALYHFGWSGASGQARNDVSVQLENVRWSISAVSVAKAMGCQKFVGAGSIIESEAIMSSESGLSVPAANQIYGTGKLTANYMCRAAAFSLDMGFVWLTITNVYGHGDTSSRFVNSLIRSLLSGDAPQLTSCTQLYDFIYISDLAEYFYLLGDRGESFQKYIAGSGNPRPLREFVLELRDIVSPGAEINFGAAAFLGRSLTEDYYDNAALLKDTGYTPRISFAEGIRRTKDWIKQANAL